MKQFFSLIVLCFVILKTQGQIQPKDSVVQFLQLKIDQASSDSLKIPLQIALAKHLKSNDLKQAKTMLSTVVETLETDTYTSRYFLQQKADAYNTLGECAQDQSDKTSALEYFLKSVQIAEALNDPLRMGNAYHNLGYLYYSKGDKIKGLYYTRKAITIRESLGKDHVYDLAMTFNVLALGYQEFKQPDSALYYLQKAKKVDSSENALIITNSNMAYVYIGQKQYDEAIPLIYESIAIAQDQNDYLTLSSHYQNLGYVYRKLKQYDKAIVLTDSAISYARAIGNKRQLENEYYSRHTIYKLKGDYKRAYEDYKLSVAYLDSIKNIEELNKFTELDLRYQFEKEKEIAQMALQSEAAKKQIYFILLFVILLLAMVIIYFINKAKKQKIELAKREVKVKEMEKMKAHLKLANRENELKKVVIDNSITEEVLNATLDEIKGIIILQDEKERKQALRTLSASLLNEKSRYTSATSLQSYLDEVHIDFKLHLDKNFPQFNSKEKELICLIKLGLTTEEISKILNTTLSSVKSTRYRARKKLAIEPSIDIIAHIEQTL